MVRGRVFLRGLVCLAWVVAVSALPAVAQGTRQTEVYQRLKREGCDPAD